MYYAVIHKKAFKMLPTEPPTTPASAINEGQTFSGTNNSLWQSTKESKSVMVRKWVEVTVAEPVPPNRSAASADVNVEVTAADGSIWKGVATGGSSATWERTGETSNSNLTTVTKEGSSCTVIGAKARSLHGFPDPETMETTYYEYTCQAAIVTYSWRLVRKRKTCSTCPPTPQTHLGDQCSCGYTVYELKDVPEIQTNYYWKKIKDEATLTLEANEIVSDITIELTRRTYDADTGVIEGFLENDIEDPFIFEIKDEQDKSIYSGFIKNWKWADGTVRFNIEDFRVVLDTDIILDYSHGDNDFRLSKVYEKVAEQVKSSAGSFLYDFIIPNDLIDTATIADYSNQYIIVNALRFLKTYLSYHTYIIDKEFDYNQNKVVFTFRKQISNPVEIRLEDFVHEKTKTDIKTNRVVATIKFQTIYEVDSEWQETTQIAWETAAIENKSTVVAEELPALEGYTKDHVIRLVKNVHFTTITESQYNALANKLEEVIDIPSGQGGGTQQGAWNVQYAGGSSDVPTDAVPIIINPYQGNVEQPPTEGASCSVHSSIVFAYYYVDWVQRKTYLMYLANCNGYIAVQCPINAPDLSVINSLFDPKDYEYDTGIKIQYRDSSGNGCGNFIYAKVHSTDIEYYSKGGIVVVPRPKTLASKTYSLGMDNNIYEGTPPSDLMIYPVKTDRFEAETLSKAQVDAIYSLVNNRWNENIIIDSTLAPAEVHKLELLQLVKVYDRNGDSKLLPVSEIISKHNLNRTYKVKLGFKKELFTQIYKSESSQGVLK